MQHHSGGADINLGAIQTTTKRLNSIIAEKKQAQRSLLDDGSKPYLNFEVYNVNNYDVFRNPVQARELLIQALEIDPLESTDVFDGMKDGYKVKIMPVNRIVTRADLNPLLNGINYRELDRQMEASPGSPAERIMLVCMGHESDLAASLTMDIGSQYRVEVKVVDILRDRKDLTSNMIPKRTLPWKTASWSSASSTPAIFCKISPFSTKMWRTGGSSWRPSPLTGTTTATCCSPPFTIVPRRMGWFRGITPCRRITGSSGSRSPTCCRKVWR